MFKSAFKICFINLNNSKRLVRLYFNNNIALNPKAHRIIITNSFSSSFKVPSFNFKPKEHNFDDSRKHKKFNEKNEQYFKQQNSKQNYDDLNVGYQKYRNKSWNADYEHSNDSQQNNCHTTDYEHSYVNYQNQRRKPRSTSKQKFQTVDRRKIFDTTRPNILNLNKSNNEILFGIFPVLSAIQAKRRKIHCFYYRKNRLENKNILAIYNACQSLQIPCNVVSKHNLSQLAGEDAVNQGVCLEVSPLQHLDIKNLDYEDQFQNTQENSVKPKLIVFLDQINDPMNFGALIRTASFLGIHSLITSSKNICPLSNIVSKASAGVAEYFPIYKAANPEAFLLHMKERNWQIVSSIASKDGMDVSDFVPTEKTILIVGNEGRGISEELMNISDQFLSIGCKSVQEFPVPQNLNVSVATSILIYSLMSKTVKN